MTTSLPDSARAVVVGGGIVGASVAYHLAGLNGWQNTVLIEQQRIGGGTTWHAAGMVGRLRTSSNTTKINKYSAELYERLEAETGVPTGWKKCGSMMVAQTRERMTQLHRMAAMAELFGVEAHMVDPAFIADKWPLLRTNDLLGAAWLPGDGKVQPEQTTKALAEGARQRGATICEQVRVLNLLREGRRLVGVETTAGTIRAEVVILCGGMWTRQLGLHCGIDVPLAPVEHHYAVTNSYPGAHDDLPIVRDPDGMIYIRPDGDTIWLGGFQKYSKPWMVDRVPDNFSFQLLEDDWEKFAPPLAAGKQRLPDLERVGFSRFINGPESFTPDGNFIFGPPPRIEGCFLVSGFNSGGIACAGGVGQLLAQWVESGEAPCDLWGVDPRRFGAWQNNRSLLRQRTAEVLGWHYELAWPNREPETARNVRRSTLYDRLQQAGACYGQKSGWERPLWYARSGMVPEMEYSFDRQNWFACSAAEHMAARETAAIFDQTSFSKFVFQGPDALKVLQRLCANNVDVPEGKVVYTALLNRKGTFESDLTLVRQRADRFYIITSTAQSVRDADWIERNTPADAHATLFDVTCQYGVLGLMGPRSRDVLARVTDADISNEAFPFGTARQISVGSATVLAVRITYVGELGWELHVPIEQMPAAYEALWEAGKADGLTNAGNYAINSLRVEKGYCAWGADISPDETPLEAGLGFAVDFNTEFLGREALLQQRETGPRKRRVALVLQDADPYLWGSEPIWMNGKKVGYTTSGAYGHALGGAVAMGYVPLQAGQKPSSLLEQQFEIEVDGRRYAAAAHLKPPYDPTNERIKG